MLQPIAKIQLATYSITDAQLTGIIDNPSVFESLNANLQKTASWIAKKQPKIANYMNQDIPFTETQLYEHVSSYSDKWLEFLTSKNNSSSTANSKVHITNPIVKFALICSALLEESRMLCFVLKKVFNFACFF